MTSPECLEIVPIKQVNEDEVNKFDYTQSFTMDQVFHSRQSLCNWVHKVGNELGLIIVMKRSKRGGYGRKPRICFGCERGGKYRTRKNHSDSEPKRKRSVGTRKCECPFDLSDIKMSNEDNWMVHVRCGLHNHPPAQHLEGHPYVARLTSEEENSFLEKVRECIFSVLNFDSDGNCGYRAVASSLGRGEEAWCQIRHDLIHEINSNCDIYQKLFGNEEGVKELLHILSYFNTNAPIDRWMVMPEMSYLIASRYNVVLVLLSKLQCLTFLPLRSPSPPSLNHRIISLGLVHGNHFVQVNLKLNCPIPPVALYWYKYKDVVASGWETTYKARIEAFKEMIGKEVATQDTINLSSQ